MNGFVGRSTELQTLQSMLARTTTPGRAGRPGRALLMRGRRRVGKSRLVEEFIDLAAVPHVFFTASAAVNMSADLDLFARAVRSSTLPGAAVFEGQSPQTWDAALRLLSQALPTEGPAVVVLDEMPYLISNDTGFEGALQNLFDREFSRLPMLLICIGSDLAMMEALNEYGRPFHQRASEMVVAPLTPRDVAEILNLSPADAIDAYLVSGGLPLILDEWPPGDSIQTYLEAAVSDPTSAMVVSGERALAAEFPAETQARRVLEAIGSGERTFTSISRGAGSPPQASLARALMLLTRKRAVQAMTPLSTNPSSQTRYIVADPHLRFWLTFVGPHLPEIERRRSDLVMARIRTSWSSWRGRAVEPVVRESLNRLADRLPAGTVVVGAYWTRTNDPEIDLVGADREPVARNLSFVGSIKWQEQRPFDGQDLAALVAHRRQLPGATAETPLVAVSRSGVAPMTGVIALGAEDLLSGY